MKAPKVNRLRRRYMNTDYPAVVLKFEDGHEIQVKKGQGKAFDAYEGEVIKIIAMHDLKAPDRDVLESRKAEGFDPA